MRRLAYSARLEPSFAREYLALDAERQILMANIIHEALIAQQAS